jgi:hypothetical protein
MVLQLNNLIKNFDENERKQSESMRNLNHLRSDAQIKLKEY